MKRQLWIVLLTALAGVMGLAQAAAQSSQTESLGDLARKVREEKAKSGTKPVKVYTNDDIHRRRRDADHDVLGDVVVSVDLDRLRSRFGFFFPNLARQIAQGLGLGALSCCLREAHHACQGG